MLEKEPINYSTDKDNSWASKMKIWTNERLDFLLQTINDSPKLTNEELAVMVQKQYPDIKITVNTIKRGKTFLHNQFPELKKKSEVYNWTEEKTNFLIQLLKENPKLSYEELARKLNEHFPNQIADGNKVKRMLIVIYNKQPELRKQKKRL